VAKKTQPDLWYEPPKKYDFYTQDYLIREDKDTPDILLYPPWRDELLIQLGSMDMLTGKALIEYTNLIERRQDANNK